MDASIAKDSNELGPGRDDRSVAGFTPGRFALLLLVLLCAAFPEVVTGRGTFFHRDFGLFTYPAAYFQRECFWRGELPLWNPFNYCGIPFLAQWNTSALYPPALLYLLLPLSWSLGVFCLAHLLLAGVGAYLLAWRWTGCRLAAAGAGVAFAFNGLMLNCLMWISNLAALAWMPWVILTVEAAVRDGGRRRVLVAALVGALQMLSGAPEPILLTWVVSLVMLGAQAVMGPSSSAWGQAVPTPALGEAGQVARARQAWRRQAGRWTVIVLLICGLAAAQLLPFWDLLRHSQREPGFSDSTWSMPIWGWANFFIPLYRCYPSTFGIYAQPDQYWVLSYYPGAGVVALALLAAWHVRQPRVWLLAILTVVCVVLAMGDPGWLYGALRRVLPWLGLMRYPVKFLTLPILLLPLLAAFALQQYAGDPGADRHQLKRRTLVLLIATLVAIAGLVYNVYRRPTPDVSPWVTAESGLTRAGFLLLILGSLAAWSWARRPPLREAVRLGTLLLLWLDVMTFGPRPNPTVPPSVYQPNLARAELHLNPLPTLGQGRVMARLDAVQNLYYSSVPDPAENYLYSRLALFGNCNLLDQLPNINGFFSIFFKEMSKVYGVLYGAREPLPRLADFLGVSQVTVPGKSIAWSARPTALPWITAGQAPRYADEADTLAGLAAPDFDPRRVVYLPREARGQVTSTGDSSAKVTVNRFSTQQTEFEVEAARPALVVVAQAYYDCWRARVDGKLAPLWRANEAFQAVEVPAGRHRVALKYEDRWFRAGAILSLAALAAGVIAWFWPSKRQ